MSKQKKRSNYNNKGKRNPKHKRNSQKVGPAAVIVTVAGIVLVVAVILIWFFVQRSSQGEEEGVTHELDVHYEDYDRIDAPYEDWLAAAVITSISMNTPDFELGEIYTATETTLDNKSESQGVYVTYQSAGETKCIQSVPLEAGRSNETGTRDIYTEVIGYATYDEVSADSMDTTVWKSIETADLNTLIEQSERVVLYDN